MIAAYALSLSAIAVTTTNDGPSQDLCLLQLRGEQRMGDSACASINYLPSSEKVTQCLANPACQLSSSGNQAQGYDCVVDHCTGKSNFECLMASAEKCVIFDGQCLAPFRKFDNIALHFHTTEELSYSGEHLCRDRCACGAPSSEHGQPSNVDPDKTTAEVVGLTDYAGDGVSCFDDPVKCVNYEYDTTTKECWLYSMKKEKAAQSHLYPYVTLKVDWSDDPAERCAEQCSCKPTEHPDWCFNEGRCDGHTYADLPKEICALYTSST